MTQEQKEDFKSGFEIAYQLEDFDGVCEWVMNFIEIDIESKLSQDAVISSVCDCEKKVYEPKMSGEVKCLRCSKMIAQTDL